MAVAPIGAVGGLGGLGGVSGISGASAPIGLGSSQGLGTAGLDPTASDPTGQAGSSFIDTLGQAFGTLNQQLTTADASMADFAAGGSSDLHTVMLQMQEASIGLKVGIQVRDRLLEAYQDIMRMQL